MEQLIAVALAVILIPLLLKFKIPVGAALIILGMFAGIVGGLSSMDISSALWDVFLVPSNLSSVLIVIEIGMLSVLMAHYGILDQMETALREFLPFPKLLMMLFPAVVGALQAPGGAALSAPLVNRLGTEMGLTRGQRANTNVICRHVLMLLAPFSANMIVVQSVAPEVPIMKLALLNLGFVLLSQIAAYYFLLRNGRTVSEPEVSGKKRLHAFWKFNVTFSPIYLIILLNGLFHVPYTAAILCAIGLVFFLGGREDFPRQVFRSFSWNLAILIVGVYFFQNIVGRMGDLLALFEHLVSAQSELAFLVTAAVVGTIFGLATGLMYLPLGVLVPIVANAAYPSEWEMMVRLFYVFLWCFIGYYFSPIHLCQLLTDKEVGCTPGERYRTYLPILFLFPLFTVGLYLLYSLFLP